jgi:hypothetical protein
MITITDAIKSLCPEAQFSIVDNAYSKLTWLSSTIGQPSEIEIQLEISRLQELAQLNEYKKIRKAAYPSIEEQLDMIYWDKVNGTNLWQESIDSVKQQYPKPENL